MKAMYKQPKTEVSALETKLMQDPFLTLSPQGGEGPGGQTGNEAPSRFAVEIP